MKLAIGNDHAGFQLKNKVISLLQGMGHEVEDFGTYNEESTDYPDYAHAVASAVENTTHSLGVLICGSGNGISMAANKHQGIRSAICWNTELAGLARQHNNANIVTLPARFISEEDGLAIVKAFMDAEFEGGRHERRVNKIACV